MEKETIIDNLEKLLMAIHRQVVEIRDAEDKIPKIEFDKTLSNIRALYEQFTVLNYLNAYPPEKKVAAPAPVPQEVKIPVAAPEIPRPVAEKPAETEKESPFIPIVEKQPDPQPAAVPAPLPPVAVPVYAAPEPQPIVEKIPGPEPQKPVVPAAASDEKYQPRPQAASTEPAPVSKPAPAESGEPMTLADRLRLQKLDDLHKAVSLSDKFLYMNELFGGENQAYKDALDHLNRSVSSAEAERYLDGLGVKFGWAEHPKTEKKFRELVSRKFI